MEAGAAPHLLEFEQQRALQKPVNLMKLVKSMQHVKKKKQLVSLHIEEESSDAGDERMIQDEAPQVAQALENDSERKRTCLDDVPIQTERGFEKRSFPQTRDDPGAAEHSPHLAMTLVSNTEGYDQWIPASMRRRLERPLGRRAVGLRVHGENRGARITHTVTPWCGRLTIKFEDGDEVVKMLDENVGERKDNTTGWASRIERGHLGSTARPRT